MILTYKTIQKPLSYEIPKIKWSKFIWHILPVSSKEEAEEKLETIQKQHYQANHHCFAYRVGIRHHQDLFGNWLIDPERIYASDDGEPSGSASYPIKNVIKWAQLEDVLLVVTRYFGWIKLWIWWLVQAYTEASKEVIAHANIITKEVLEEINIEIEQAKVPEFLSHCSKENIKIISQNYTEKATFTVWVNVTKIEAFKEKRNLL